MDIEIRDTYMGEARKKLHADSKGAKATLRYTLTYRFRYGLTPNQYTIIHIYIYIYGYGYRDSIYMGEARKKLHAERSKGAKATLRYILSSRFIYGLPLTSIL